MEDRLIGRLGLAVHLRVNHNCEPHLTPRIGQIVRELTGVKLLVVIKNDGARNAEVSDNVAPNEPSHFSDGYRFYDLSLYPFDEIVDRHKKYLRCSIALGKDRGYPVPMWRTAGG